CIVACGCWLCCGCLAAAIKRQSHHRRGYPPIADVDINRRRRSRRGREIRHPERPVETRRKGSARYCTNFALAHEKLVALASDATAVFGADSNQVAPEPVALLCGERGGADEVAAQLHERTEARLER